MKRTREDIYDELLVLRAQEGDRKAMEELVGRWQSRLLGHAFRIMGRSDGAPDACQEAMIAIVRSIGRLDDPARFRQWAYRIVTNKCTDSARRGARSRRAARDRAASGPEADANGPGEALDMSDEIDRLRAAMRRMDAQRRAILQMRYLEGMGLSSIAEALGVPRGTVKSRLHAAREELKGILGKDER